MKGRTRREAIAAAIPALAAGIATAQRTSAPVRLPKKVRVAMLGFDGHPGIITGDLKRLPDVEVVAIYDANPRQLQAQARKPELAQARRYSSYRELLENEQIDIAGVCGPTSEHAPAILACAERKIHVASEKPLALDIADLEKIKKAVARKGIRLTMFLPMRFYGVYRAMRDIVRSGAIGEPAQIDAQKSYKLGERAEWMRHRSEFGGTIPYIGIHMVDLIRFTSGRELVNSVSMSAQVGRPDMGEMENTTGTVFKMDNGGVAVMHLDYLRPETAEGHGDDRLRIAGTKGVVEYSEHRGFTVVTDAEAEHEVKPVPPNESLFIDFLKSVYEGTSHGLPLQDIYRANEIVLAARDREA